MHKQVKRKISRKYKWFLKEQLLYMQGSFQNLLTYVQLYELHDAIRIYPSVQLKDNLLVVNTIKRFNAFAMDNGDSSNCYMQIKSELQSIKQYDVVFRWHGDSFLFHTYKILGFVQESILAYELANDAQFQKTTIGKFTRIKQSYRLMYERYKKALFTPLNTFRGNDLVSAYLYRNLYYHEKFTKQYLSLFAQCGIDNIKLLDNDRLDSGIMKSVLKVFMSGSVDKTDCANSLLCVLYFYFEFMMQVPKGLALQVAKSIVYEIYEISNEYKGSEILRNVYVKEVIGSHVVFGFNSKKEVISPMIKERYAKMLMNQNDIVELDVKKLPRHAIENSLDNPLKLYSLLTPSELLQEMK